jgi:hypothetical protein
VIKNLGNAECLPCARAAETVSGGRRDHAPNFYFRKVPECNQIALPI